jgi:CheY-like chemotaxis protein
MTDEVKSRIFEPFFTTKFIGRGLGLAAVQGIIRGHKGAIKVYTQHGKGTTFKVLFPAQDNNVVRIPVDPQTTLSAFGRNRTVLVIDDEPEVRGFAVRILEKFGFKAISASDGNEGLSEFRKANKVDLVLLDLTMPLMSGSDAFRELRQIHPDVTVILTSGYNEAEATSGFEGKGLSGFLRKPFRVQELLAAVYAQIGP